MEIWNDMQYAAWVVYGMAVTMCSLYYLQVYYYNFWFFNPSNYSRDANVYSYWGLAMTINTLTQLFIYIPSMILWLLCLTNDENLIYFFVTYIGWTHYMKALQFTTVALLKIVGLFQDRATSYNSYSGLA